MDIRNLKIKNLSLKDAVVAILFGVVIALVIANWSGVKFTVALIAVIIYIILRIFDKDENTIIDFDAKMKNETWN